MGLKEQLQAANEQIDKLQSEIARLDAFNQRIEEARVKAVNSMVEARESAKRSIEAEIDKSKGGNWRTRPVRWVIYGAIAAAILGVAVWANAQSGSIPLSLRFDVYAFCDPISKTVMIDSDLLPEYIATRMPCVKQS